MNRKTPAILIPTCLLLLAGFSPAKAEPNLSLANPSSATEEEINLEGALSIQCENSEKESIHLSFQACSDDALSCNTVQDGIDLDQVQSFSIAQLNALRGSSIGSLQTRFHRRSPSELDIQINAEAAQLQENSPLIGIEGPEGPFADGDSVEALTLLALNGTDLKQRIAPQNTIAIRCHNLKLFADGQEVLSEEGSAYYPSETLVLQGTLQESLATDSAPTVDTTGLDPSVSIEESPADSGSPDFALDPFADGLLEDTNQGSFSAGCSLSAGQENFALSIWLGFALSLLIPLKLRRAK